MEECRNNKTDLIFCFIDFRKAFDMVPTTNLWSKLEETKFPFELKDSTTRLYEKVIVMFRNIEGKLEKNNCNIGVK